MMVKLVDIEGQNSGVHLRTDVDKIKAVWDDFARKYGLDCRASTPDACLVDLEVRTLRKYIGNGEKLLDIGCGNGYTSIKLAQKRTIKVIGIDISSEMIQCANQMLRNYMRKLKGEVQFEVGNILSLDFVEHFGEGRLDTVVTKRTLINVLSWGEQKETIIKILHLLKPKGKYIMIEGTMQGYENMNSLRERFGIPRTPIRWHNNYLDEGRLIPFLNENFDITCVRNFSSTYYIGSRVIQPLILKPFRKEPRYDFFLNRLFSYVPSFGDYGIQKLIVCRKKEH